MGWRNIRQEIRKGSNVFVMDRPPRGRQTYAGDSTVMVSIRSYEEGVPKGVFICFEYDQRYEFQGLDQMLLIMEDIMDSLSVPYPAFEHRSFCGKPYIFQEMEPERRRIDGKFSLEDIPRLPHGKASFVVRTYYRQSGSMQGEMIAAAGKRVAFRSALELMRLIHEYLEMECC